MFEDADLSRLNAIFLGLAQGEHGEVSPDVVFVPFADGDEPSRTVRKVQDTLRGPVFEFRRPKEGWLEGAELVESGPGHQYVSRGLSDEALLMVSYSEGLAERGGPTGIRRT